MAEAEEGQRARLVSAPIDVIMRIGLKVSYYALWDWTFLHGDVPRYCMVAERYSSQYSSDRMSVDIED